MLAKVFWFRNNNLDNDSQPNRLRQLPFTTTTMNFKIKKIIGLFIFSLALLLGLLSIYRATIKTSQLTIVKGKVIHKKIEKYKHFRGGTNYCLAFRLANREDKIAINLGTKSQAEKDPAVHLIDTGKAYEFYLDPTVPTIDGENWGIDKIDYNNVEIYKTSNELNLYAGTFLSILSIVLIVMMLKHKEKGKES